MSEATYREEIDTNLGRPATIHWGALLAGLFTMIAVAWLMYLLGLAIGVTAMDLSDSTLIGEGLSQGALLWMVLTAAAAYFIGAALTARVSGTTDSSDGMLQGVALWGVATTASLVAAYCGLTSLMQTGSSLAVAASNATSATANAAAGSIAGVTSQLGGAAASLSESGLASTIRERLRDEIARAVTEIDPEGGEEISEEAVRESIEQLDANTLDRVATQLADEDQESAAELIAEATELSSAQAEELINGAYEALERQLGDPDNDQSLAEDLRSSLIDQVAAVLSSFDPAGGESVSEEELREALAELDNEQLQTAATALAQGRTDDARDLLVEETDLKGAEVEEIIDGVTGAYKNRINRLAEYTEEASEKLSTYAMQLSWAAFATTAFGLAVSVVGGLCGADTSRRLYYEVREVRHED
ncbi:MAG: hypothetical protein AAF266_16465 [Planctomycetota bacterium]